MRNAANAGRSGQERVLRSGMILFPGTQEDLRKGPGRKCACGRQVKGLQSIAEPTGRMLA